MFRRLVRNQEDRSPVEMRRLKYAVRHQNCLHESAVKCARLCRFSFINIMLTSFKKTPLLDWKPAKIRLQPSHFFKHHPSLMYPYNPIDSIYIYYVFTQDTMCIDVFLQGMICVYR